MSFQKSSACVEYDMEQLETLSGPRRTSLRSMPGCRSLISPPSLYVSFHYISVKLASDPISEIRRVLNIPDVGVCAIELDLFENYLQIVGTGHTNTL